MENEKKEIFFTDIEVFDDIELSKFFEVCSKMVNDFKEVCFKNWEVNKVSEEDKFKFSDKVIVAKEDDSDPYSNTSYSKIVLKIYRWESDKEYEKRLETNRKERERQNEKRKKQREEQKKKAKLKKEKDYKLYLELKQKFE